MDQEIEGFVNDFVFRDARIGSHPKIRAVVFWAEKGALSLWEGASDEGAGLLLRLQRSVSGHAFSEKQVIIVSDAAGGAVGRRSDLAEIPQIRSMLLVPLLRGADPCGVLDLSANDAGLFSQADVGRAQLLGAILVYLRFRPKGLRSPQSVALGQALKGVRHELGLTQDQLAAELETSRIALSQWERGSWPPSTGPLYRWCHALGLTLPEHRALVSVLDVTPTLLRILREDPNQLVRLSPTEFERFVAERMDRMGFDVTLTGPTSQRDGGIDLIAIPKVRTVGSFLIAGQIKHHSTGEKVSRSDVDRLLAWKDSPFRLGLLVTNTAFTRDALWIAEQNASKAFLRLRGFNDLKRWIEDDFYSEENWREIPDRITLAPGITIQIPKATAKDALAIWPLSVRTDWHR